MKKSLRFIINPISGVGQQKLVEKLIKKHLDVDLYNYDIVYTKHAGHATQLSSQAADDGLDIVAIVGGDGSVNEAATGLTGKQTALAILPAGSGNGLARHLHIPMKVVDSLALLNGNYREINIDSVKLNDRYFFNVAGIGFDAHIGTLFAQYHKRGFLSYIKIVFREFARYKEQAYKMTIDGKTYQRKAFLVSFANGSQYGNNARIAPLAAIDDGLLSICILKRFPLYAAPGLVIRMFKGSMHRSKYLETITGMEIEVQQHATFAHIDGEPIEAGNNIHIQVEPRSLKMVVPKG